MTGFVVAFACLVATLVTAGMLAGARRLVDEYISAEDASMPRYAGWLAVLLAGLAALTFFESGWIFLFLGGGLTFWLFLGAAIEVRGSEGRQRLGFIQLYVGLLLVTYAYLHGKGLVEGMVASSVFTFALHQTSAELGLPALAAVLGESTTVLAGSEGRVSDLVDAFSGNIGPLIALTSFGFAHYCFAYLADRTTPNFGTQLLPGAMVASLVFAGVSAGVWIGFSQPLLADAFRFVFFVMLPFFVAEGLASVGWLARSLRTSNLLLLLLAALGLFVTPVLVALAALGWIAQVGRVRDLGPLLSTVEKRMRRPRLSAAVYSGVGSAALIAALGALQHSTLGKISPLLGAPSETCADIKVVGSAKQRAITYSSADRIFTMDVDETPIDSPLVDIDAAAAACESQGKRLCTSDEWYIGCLCTYPGESNTGLKLRANYTLVYRVSKEKEEGDERRREDETASMLHGSSEVVSPVVGATGVLMAGPNDAFRSDYAVDCRYRSLLTRKALERHRWPFIGARCCK